MVDYKTQLPAFKLTTEKSSTFGLEELLELREQLDLVFQQLQTVMGYSELEEFPKLYKKLK